MSGLRFAPNCHLALRAWVGKLIVDTQQIPETARNSVNVKAGSKISRQGERAFSLAAPVRISGLFVAGPELDGRTSCLVLPIMLVLRWQILVCAGYGVAWGFDSGSVAPRWHVQQVTRMWPLKLSALIWCAINIIFRAVCFSGLSSLSNAPST